MVGAGSSKATEEEQKIAGLAVLDVQKKCPTASGRVQNKLSEV